MIHRVPMCAMRFARNSLSGRKLASSEYFSFFFTKFFREGHIRRGQFVNARASHSELPTVGKNRSYMGV
jgi:hypothetical protein